MTAPRSDRDVAGVVLVVGTVLAFGAVVGLLMYLLLQGIR